MKKKTKTKTVLVIIISLIIESVLTFLVASAFSVRFIEVMFFMGLLFACGIFYFTSGGGLSSNFFSSLQSAGTGIIQKRESFEFKSGPVFLTSVIFCIIGLVFFILLVTEIIPAVK